MEVLTRTEVGLLHYRGARGESFIIGVLLSYPSNRAGFSIGDRVVAISLIWLRSMVSIPVENSDSSASATSARHWVSEMCLIRLVGILVL